MVCIDVLCIHFTRILCKKINSSLLQNGYSKIRLSSHCLTVETGQYTGKKQKQKRNERLCKFCTETTEDEYPLNLNVQFIINIGNNFKPFY